MDKILSILQDAQVNNTNSIINTNVESTPEHRTKSEFGHDLFNYKTIEELLFMHTHKSVDIFQDSQPGQVKDVLESYIHIFKTRYVRSQLKLQSIKSPTQNAAKLSEDSKSAIFSHITEKYDESPHRIFSSIGAYIRKEARDALKALDATESSAEKFNFGKMKLYQPLRSGPTDPFALRLGLSTKKFPYNVLACMINDFGVLERFLSNATPLPVVDTKSVQNLMVAQAIAGGLAFKILIHKHALDVERFLPELGSSMRLEKLKAIIASRSMLLKRLDWYLPYRHSLQALNDSTIENEEYTIRAMADLFDRFFGVCFKADSQYSVEWVKKLIHFCVANHGDQQFFDNLLGESISSFRDKVSSSSFDAMSAKWKQYDFLNRSEATTKHRKRLQSKTSRGSFKSRKLSAVQDLIANARKT